MQKFLVGAIALALLFPTPAKAQEPDAPCYMMTSSGKMINLGGVCGNNTVSAPAAPATPAARGSAASSSSWFNPAAYPPDRYLSMGDGSGVRSFLDKNSVRQNNKKLSFEAISVSESETTKFQFSLDRAARRFTTATMAIYNPKGQLISTQSTEKSLANLGSRTEQAATAFCRRYLNLR